MKISKLNQVNAQNQFFKACGTLLVVLLFCLPVYGQPDNDEPDNDEPDNDECVDATEFTDIPFTDDVNTTTATNNTADPILSCNAGGIFTDGNTVWYQWTPEDNVTVQISSFGSDYDTADGTCLRDYTHVDDLCRAHVQVLSELDEQGSCLFYNLGTGRPSSVRQVIESVARVTSKNVPTREAERRRGDPPILYADPAKAQRELGWELRYAELDTIVETAWRWHRDHPDGYASG